ncbi:MAG: hypothetical protein WC008_02820 [Bacilli bacterium]
MKWALSQLYKLNGKPFVFETEFDFKDRITNIDDIIDIKVTKVSGTGKNIIDDRYSFDLHISTVLILEDAVTLDEIEFPIDIEVTEDFDVIDDGECNLIEKNTIDLEPIIWEIVYLEKPMRITKSNL